MKTKLVSNQDNYKAINDFSSRALCVYNEQLLMAKVKFHEMTEDYGFHKHPHDQIVYVLEGKFLFVIEGKEYEVEAGDTLLVESNLEHGCIPLVVPGKLLDVFNPVREDFLVEGEDASV